MAALEALHAQEAPPSSQPPTAVHHQMPACQGVVALFLPRNTDLCQLASLVPDGHVWEVGA